MKVSHIRRNHQLGSRLTLIILFRIGTSSRDDAMQRTAKENLPGPGNYNLKSIRSTPSFRFGTEKRGQSAKNETPGPGQYKIPCTMVDVNDYTRSTGGFNPQYRYI